MMAKIDKAKQMIVQGNESIGDIAVHLGYGSFSYFTEIFKRITGSLPSDFKKEKQNNTK